MIDKKYSLRVELDRDEETKLRAMASRMGLSLADLVRDYIASSPAPYTPDDFEAFKQKHDRLFKKLVAWQTKHISKGFIDKYAKEIAETTVNDYLAAVALAESQSQLISAINYWDSKLSRQEKTAISKVFPFSVSSLEDSEIIDTPTACFFVKGI
jgi:predicted RecB family endonuclease